MNNNNERCNNSGEDSSNTTDRSSNIEPYFYFVVNIEEDSGLVPLIKSIENLDYNKIFIHFVFCEGRLNDIYNNLKSFVSLPFKVTKLKDKKDLLHGVNIFGSGRYVVFCDCVSSFDVEFIEDIKNMARRKDPVLCYVTKDAVILHNSFIKHMLRCGYEDFDLDLYVSEAIKLSQENNIEVIVK